MDDITKSIVEKLEIAKRKCPSVNFISSFVSTSGYRTFQLCGPGVDEVRVNVETWQELADFIDAMQERNEILFRKF